MFHVHHLDPNIQVSMQSSKSRPDILIQLIYLNFHIVYILIVFLSDCHLILSYLIFHLVPYSHGSMEVFTFVVHLNQYLKCIHVKWLLEFLIERQY